MDKSIDIRNLKRCAEISRQSRAGGNTPFGALLADKEGNILLEQPNVEITENKCTGHAETQVAEKASQQYSKDFLKDCTLYLSLIHISAGKPIKKGSSRKTPPKYMYWPTAPNQVNAPCARPWNCLSAQS